MNLRLGLRVQGGTGWASQHVEGALGETTSAPDPHRQLFGKPGGGSQA